MSANLQATDPYIWLSADDARREVLLAIARRYKGVDPEVDKRLDAAAERIFGVSGAKSVPGERAGANRVPLYFEGEPGVGKTSLIRGAIRDFCSIAGLNLVENPPEDYELKDSDFYYCTVNLSGKQNTSDFGGMPFRTEAQSSEAARERRQTADVGARLSSEFVSAAKAIAAYDGMRMGETKQYEDGGLAVTEFTLAGEPDKAQRAIERIVLNVAEEAKKSGVALSAAGESGQGDRLTYDIRRGTSGVRVYLRAPKVQDARAEYVTAALPNLRFHLAKHAKWSLFNFDDVANASENIRNVLLEVAQFGRYSGTMDIGNALMTFTGNIGSEDNTNVMSKQSDAEVTRIRKFRIQDSPKDWARRITEKYNESDVGDCHFASFVERQGNQEGIFREPPGAARGKRGVPKTNSRALENALNVVDGYFMMAKASGINPAMFLDRIQSDVAATAGRRVAIAYQAHLASMLTEAIPLADACIDAGKMDDKRYEKHAGSFIQSSQKDFGFRFAYALADSAVNKVFEDVKARRGSDQAPDYKQLGKVFGNMCVGLSRLPADMMNASVSRFAHRLSAVKELGAASTNGSVLNSEATVAISEAIGKALKSNLWDPAEHDAITEDLSRVLLGRTVARPDASVPSGSSTKPSTFKPR